MKVATAPTLKNTPPEKNEKAVYSFVDVCAEAYDAGKLKTSDGHKAMDRVRNRIKRK